MLEKYTFITTPMLNCNETIVHKGAKIEINGRLSKCSIWAKDKAHFKDVIDDFIMALEECVDPLLQAKLVVGENEPVKNYHPSDASWAYAQLPLSQIPAIDVSVKTWDRVRKTLDEYSKVDQ